MADLIDVVERMADGEIVEGVLSEEGVQARRKMESHWAFLRNEKAKRRWKKIHERALKLYIERLRFGKKE